jgi:small basic protein
MAKKVTEVSAPAGSRRLGRHTIVRLTAYYLIAGAVLFLLTALFPFAAMSPVDTAPTGMAQGLDWFRWQLAILPAGAPRWVDACVQMAAALLLVLPMAFTYVRTRTRLKYDHSLVQTVVVLPIVVTAILVVVKDSLALAFSLAGIVAAVRFRNNLRESGDAVYIFGSIGIGFAAGIHALGVAAALSAFFVVLELALWKLNLGGEFDDTFRRLCMPTGADLATPPQSAGEVPATPPGNGRKRAGEGFEADARALVLRIYVLETAAARPAIERVLARDAKQWAATGTEAGEGASGVLEYRVRPRKSVGFEALRDHVLAEGAPHVIAADEAAPAQRL